MSDVLVPARLSVERLVSAARGLLVRGGPDAVVIREVARSLGVAPSAMYKHVAGRDELLGLLIGACYDQVCGLIETARDAAAPGAHRARLTASTMALRSWAVTNPAEFSLLFGSPLTRYCPSGEGPPAEGHARFGRAFIVTFSDALADGKLRTRLDDDLPVGLAGQLSRAGSTWNLRAGELFPVIVGLQRMLGIVAMEVTGQLSWALDDVEPFTLEQLHLLTEDLLRM